MSDLAINSLAITFAPASGPSAKFSILSNVLLKASLRLLINPALDLLILFISSGPRS